MNQKPFWLIPECVILSCSECGFIWFQTNRIAFTKTTEICVCPECNSPWKPFEQKEKKRNE